MEAGYIAFMKGLTDLQQYIEQLNTEQELIAFAVKLDQTVLPESITELLRLYSVDTIAQRRRFIYNSIIVSLYGLLEQYIEGLIRDYISHLNTIFPRFADLPEQIIKNHLECSLALLSKIDLPRYQTRTTVPDVVSNLNSCLTDNGNYQLNSEAFTMHTANFRVDSIREIFAKIGMANVSVRIKGANAFIKYLAQTFPDRELEQIEANQALAIIDDLAERRNDVAHGMTSEILSNAILLDYIEFFKAFGAALYNLVSRNALPYEAEILGIELGLPLGVFSNGTVVGLSIKNLTIRTGDFLIAKPAKDSQLYFGGEIKELQVNRKSLIEVKARNKPIEVGIKIPFKAKKNQQFFLVPRKMRTKGRTK